MPQKYAALRGIRDPFSFRLLNSATTSGSVVTDGDGTLPVWWDDGHLDEYTGGYVLRSLYDNSPQVDTRTLAWLLVAVYDFGLYFVKEMDELFMDPLLPDGALYTAILWRIDGATDYQLPQ